MDSKIQAVLIVVAVIAVATIGVSVGAALGGGGGSEGGTAQGADVAVFGKPLPPPTDFESSFKPTPGGLYFITNGSISYNSQAKHPWVVVIDAKTKKIVAASEIPEATTSPHGVSVSPDGKQVYLPAGSAQPNFLAGTDAAATRFKGGVTIVDLATLKQTQSIETTDAPHHMQILNDRYILSDSFSGTTQALFVIDPDGNKIIREVNKTAFGGNPYIGFVSPDGRYIYVTVRPPAGTGNSEAWISRVSTVDWSVEKITDVGEGAVWTNFSRDGRFAYVTIPGNDTVVKVDLEQRKVIGSAPTGRGPYGGVLSPDDKTLFVVSKGEGGRGQRGGTFVAIDVEAMRTLEERPSCTAFVCQPDHAIISPDGTELWIDNNMGYVTVFDLKTLDLKAEITMPLLADPHGGVFVQYDNKGNGHVVMDTGGPHGGVSPYVFDNENGVPSLATALANNWNVAKSSSALALGAKPKPEIQLVSTTTLDVTMEDFYFKSAGEGVVLPKGQVVTFNLTNKGQAVHNFTSSDFGIKVFDVAAGKTGVVTGRAPNAAGTYKFICTYHAGMELNVTVR
jgi:DNA-binding beta-propeller fold protein YncE/plastocyanin